MGRRDHAGPGDLKLLSRLRKRAAGMLWAERLLRAAAIPAALLGFYLVLAVFGLGNGWVFLVVALIALGALAWEASGLRAPAPNEIDRRIEAASGLKHRPLAALADLPATGGELGAEIWRLHQARMVQSLAHARAGWPAPIAAARDPYSLRALLLLLLASGLVIAGGQAPARLVAAFALPAWPFPGPVQNSWITPPAYTGQGPVMLEPGQAATALAGSRLTVILNGSSDQIWFGGAAVPENILGPQSLRADTLITRSGRLSIGPWWHRLAQWQITALAPLAPSLSLAPVTSAQTVLQLHWTARDAYGLTSLGLGISPLGFPDALPENAALPAQTGAGAAQVDAADSPFAGIPVALTLHAENLAGLAAASPPQRVMMPPAMYHDRTALALSLLRRNLALVPARATAVAARMMRLAEAPPSAISFSADVQLAALAAGIGTHGTSPQHGVDRMLALIKQIEAGPDYAPARRLAQATQALLAALAHGPPDAGTLNALLAEVQQALAQHLAAMQPAQAGAPMRGFDPAALDQMAAQIAADEQAGRTAQAQAELQQLAQILAALQNARPMTAAQAAQSQAAGQAAQGLSQLMQNEASLLNETGQGNATAAQQAGLQASLKALRGGLAKAGLPDLPGLGPAGDAMQSAQDALTQQNTANAQAGETQALQNLQKAAAALRNAMQQGMAIGQGTEAPGETQDGADPNGMGDDISLPGLNLPSTDPADSIEQEIIRRDANPNLPAATHDYLHRLLAPGQ